MRTEHKPPMQKLKDELEARLLALKNAYEKEDKKSGLTQDEIDWKEYYLIRQTGKIEELQRAIYVVESYIILIGE
jgi:hypothetical protein